MRSMSGTDSCTHSLRGDPRVVSLEQTDIRALPCEAIADDVGLRRDRREFHFAQSWSCRGAQLLPPTRAELIALIKPQFEAGRAHSRRASCAIPRSMPPSARRVELLVRDSAGGIAGTMPRRSWAATAITNSCFTRRKP